jgi:predicted NAD/FAD-binding protein
MVGFDRASHQVQDLGLAAREARERTTRAAEQPFHHPRVDDRAEQRWTPSAYVNGRQTGWYDSGYQHVRSHDDAADAVTDFIRRMAAWLSRREVIAVEE